MPDINVGDVSVDIVPDASKFPKELDAKVSPAAKRLGKEIGRTLARNISDGIRKGIGEGFVGTESTSKRQGGKSGDAFGGSFARDAKARIRAALASLPDAKIGVATSEADQKLKDLRARLAALSDKTIGIDIDSGAALVEMAAIQTELTTLGAESPNIQVKVDTAGASAELAAFRALVQPLVGGARGGGGGLSKLRSLAMSAGSGMAELAAGIGPVAIAAGVAVPIIVTLGTALAGVTAALLVPIGAAAGGLTLFGILSGLAIKKVSETSKQIDELRKKAATLVDPKAAKAAAEQADALEKSLTGPQRAFLKARDTLKGAFTKLIDGPAGKSIFGPIASGMNLLAQIMPKLEPIITAVSGALSDLLDNLSEKASGPGFANFIQKMADLAGPAIKSIASIIGSITLSFGALFRAAGGTGTSALGGITDAMARLSTYLNSTAGQDKMRAFFEWLRTNGPGILQAIGQIATYFGHVIGVMMKIGPPIIQAIGAVFGAASAYITNVMVPGFNALSAAFQAVGGVFVGVYNAAIGPVFSFLIGAIGRAMQVWAVMLGALGHVPGFGWAKDAAKVMSAAAAKALGLSSAVKKIPTGIKITASTNFAAAYRAINALNAKTRAAGGRVHYSNGYGGGQKAYASGTNNAAPGIALVGEQGPELVRFRGGEKVATAAQTRRLISSPTVGTAGSTQSASPQYSPAQFERAVARGMEGATLTLHSDGRSLSLKVRGA